MPSPRLFGQGSVFGGSDAPSRSSSRAASNSRRSTPSSRPSTNNPSALFENWPAPLQKAKYEECVAKVRTLRVENDQHKETISELEEVIRKLKEEISELK